MTSFTHTQLPGLRASLGLPRDGLLQQELSTCTTTRQHWQPEVRPAGGLCQPLPQTPSRQELAFRVNHH